MKLRTHAGLAAIMGALLMLATAQVAGAGDDNDGAKVWQDSDSKVSRNARGSERSPTQMPGRPWVDNGQGDETPVAPVPEPGTLALATLGLMTLGAALRKRRAGKAQAGGTTP